MNIHLYDEEDAPVVETGEQAVDEAAREIDAAPSKGTPVDDRRGYLGGTDAAVIAGLSPWKTPYQLYLEKTGDVQPADLSNNERVYWGTVLEEIVAREYARRNEKKIRRVNGLLFHPEYPFIAAHIDRDVLNEPRILEVKTTGRGDDWGAEGTDEIPDHYMAQVQHYLAVTGDKWADVAVLIGGQSYRQYTVERDDDFIAGLLKLEVGFWQRVADREPPAPESSDEANQMWPRSAGLTVTGNEASLLTAEQLYNTKAKIKELEAEKDRLEAQLKREMEDIGDTLVVNNRKVATWKTQARKQFDSKTFKTDYPELYEQYQSERELRVFRLSYKPGK